MPSSGNSTAVCSQSRTVKTTLRLFKGGWLMCWEMASTCPSHTPSRGCVCVGGRVHVELHICMCVVPLYILTCLLYALFTHMHDQCALVHSADWAGVLAIRKTTSGKVHINHVPQLKERNGVEMGGGRRWGGQERIMRESVWGIQRCSVALLLVTECWRHLWIKKEGQDNRLRPTGQRARG